MNLFWFHKFDSLECCFYIGDLWSQSAIWYQNMHIVKACNAKKTPLNVYRFRFATRLASKNLYFLYCSSNLLSTSSTDPLPDCFINWSTSSCTCGCAIFRIKHRTCSTWWMLIVSLPQTLPWGCQHWVSLLLSRLLTPLSKLQWNQTLLL